MILETEHLNKSKVSDSYFVKTGVNFYRKNVWTVIRNPSTIKCMENLWLQDKPEVFD